MVILLVLMVVMIMIIRCWCSTSGMVDDGGHNDCLIDDGYAC